MLVLMGNFTEFARSVERVRDLYSPTGFAMDQNVSVFETNIRVLGGLLSAHQLAVAYLFDPQRHEQAGGSNRVLRSDVFDSDGDVRWDYRNRRASGRATSAPYSADLKDALSRAPTAASSVGSSPGACTTTTSRRASFYHDVVVAALHSVSLMQQRQRLWKLRELGRRNEDACAAPYAGGVAVGDGGLALLGVCTNLHDSQYSNNATSLGGKGAATRLRPSAPPPDETHEAESDDEPLYYRYDGVLLDLALDLGRRLLPAFDTPTGIPYGTVNLVHGVPAGETPIASLAGGGTLCLEFHLLSKLTGDDRFGKAAKLATRALFGRHSGVSKLYGKHSTYAPIASKRDVVCFDFCVSVSHTPASLPRLYFVWNSS
jgi:hypothetical protein